MEHISRYRGALLGLAVGDALGTTLEFRATGTFEPLTDMVDGGPFNLEPGQWTDDTSMALCLAESLVEKRGFDPVDQLERYWRWLTTGYHSSTGTCFDVGNTVRQALERFNTTGDAYCGSTDPRTAGNGSLMRLTPVPLFYSGEPEEAINRCADSSRTTHGAAEAVDACKYFSGLIVGAVNAASKEKLLLPLFSPAGGRWQPGILTREVEIVAGGSFKRRQPPEIKGTGYVVRSLEAALWAFYSTDNFADGCLAAVNLGDDADTTGAVYGQLAGAYYGEDAIPLSWRGKLYGYDVITNLAERLFALSGRSA